MASQITISRIWRIVKEVDLQAVRREAGRRVQVLVIGENTADADELAVRLAEGQVDPTRWLTAIDAQLAACVPLLPESGRRETAAASPDVVLAVLRGRDESSDMKTARTYWAGRKVHLVTVVVAGGEHERGVRARDGAAHVAIDRIDDDGFAAVVEGLFAVLEPSRRVAIARQIPALRPRVFDALIEETARANAGYAFSTGLAETVPVLDIPLAIGDMVVLTKNQLMMSYKIALAAGKTAQPRELIVEIAGVLGGGLLFRQLFRQSMRLLVGLVPIVGLVPKVGIAYGGTWAIGRMVVLWATEGHRLTAGRLGQLSRDGLARGREIANRLGRGMEF
jgi:uncharacterized protein (DUF697 family)